MPRPTTKICLNMIVKNEEKVLPRLFRSLKDYVDYYVIVDTGSTDDTIALIRREMDAYGIPGEVHERPWVNFGVNRQQALELAILADKADWLLFIDADEELGVSDPTFYEKLEPGVSYNLEKHHGGVRYAVPHLINIRTAKYRWEGPVHNYLVVSEGPKKRSVRKDVWIIYHHGEGAKSHGLSQEEKFLRDARVLEEYLRDHPNHPRSQFYLGQSYRDAGHLERALVEYKKRAQMEEGWVEERFMAQLEVGRIVARLEKSEDIVLAELLSAYNLRPIRAEPLFELAKYFRLRKIYGMATLFAKAGLGTPRSDDTLFVPESVYEWRLLDELAVASHWVQDFATTKRACEEILARVERGLSIPEADLRRIRDNLAAAVERLEKARESAP
jgi:glycosyltransferase involved in cell wall biosynthesis